MCSGSDSKESLCNERALSSIPGSGISFGEGDGYPLQYSFLQNSMGRGAWWATVHEAAKCQTQLSNQDLWVYMNVCISRYP